MPMSLSAAIVRSLKVGRMLLNSAVQKRINCLRNDQLVISATDKQFFVQLRDLERKYFVQNEPLFERRAKIVNGKYEPTAEEGKCSLQKPQDVPATVEDGVPAAGIPQFWLTVLDNSSDIQPMIEEKDRLALKYLSDIKGRYADKGFGFVVEFHFQPNEFFDNSVLSVTYEEKCEASPDDPFTFEMGAVKCVGTAIQWKHMDSNLTVKKKKMRNTKTGHKLDRYEKADSFFNFFNPPVVTEDADNADQLVDELENHYATGLHFIEFIIPNAVLYYTGEMDDEDSDDSSSDDSSSSSDSDSSDDDRPRNMRLRKLKN